MIKPNMIDSGISDRILLEADTNGYSMVTDHVKGVLAWLANNPLMPNPEQTKHIYGYEGQYKKLSFEDHRDPTMASAVMEFQRIAFLKREPELPQELKDLLWEQPYVEIGDALLRKQHESVVAAYKLGKGESSK